ncbi:MAG: hypothetical protein RSD51_03350 [Malacoplasma sp.]
MTKSQKLQQKLRITVKHNKCRICGWDCERDNWKVCDDCISFAESVGDYEKIRKWAK